MLKRLSLVLVGALALTGAERAVAADDPAAELRQRVLAAENRVELDHAYRDLFARAGVSALKHDPNTGIALQANWELNRVFIERWSEPRQRTYWVLDPSRAERFLGFVEGRLGTDAPPWWEDAVLKAQLAPSGRMFFPGLARPQYTESEIGYWLPKGTELKRLGWKARLTVGNDSIVIPRTALALCTAGDSRITALLEPQGCYLAGYDDRYGMKFRLLRFDLAAQDVAWMADVWATTNGVVTYGGRGDHAVALKKVGGQILVFGACRAGVYAEAFDSKTGKCAYRFGTHYWNGRDPRKTESEDAEEGPDARSTSGDFATGRLTPRPEGPQGNSPVREGGEEDRQTPRPGPKNRH